ncbi:MAG: hypothetical protein KBT87_14695 [Gammaproteobacteria bacterium]|nr:hypothetical protein [Gammaproteobacteria bacterium]
MSFDAKVLRILVASPGDVGEERSVVPEVINEWNAVSAFQTKIILMPVKWETNSAPMLGDRPQAIINEQMVKECDLLVGVFWTRIGTQTGVSVSGTAEEIEQFVDLGKPVMLYFSQSPVDPDKIDIDQFGTLRKFKEGMRLKGLTESYSGIPDFRQKFSRQLGINLNSLVNQESEKQKKRKGKSSGAKVSKPAKDTLLTQAIEKPTQAQLNEYLLKSAKATADDDGWADLAAFGLHLKTYTPVDYREFGQRTLSKFIESTGLFEMERSQKSPNAKAVDSAKIRPKSGA